MNTDLLRENTGRTVIALLVLLALAASPASAAKTDRIQFPGMVIIGEVKSLDEGVLRISTDYTKSIQADWEEVLRVESKMVFEVQALDGSRYFGTLVASDEDRVLAIQQDDGVVRLPFAQVVEFDQTKLGFWGDIDASIALGYSFVQATDTTQGSIEADASRRSKRIFSNLSLLSILSQTGDDRFTRNDFSFTVLRNLPGRWTYDAAGEFQTNESLGLDQRLLLRGSAMHRTLRTNIRELLLGAGLAVSREQYVNEQAGENSLEGRLSIDYRAFHFDDPELQVATSLVAYPSFTVQDRIRSEFDASVRRELVSDLFWSLNLHWAYDSHPTGENARTSDLNVSFSLGWSL